MNSNDPFGDFGVNAGYVEELHNRYLQSPQSVPEHWRALFDGRAGVKTSNGHTGETFDLTPNARNGSGTHVVTHAERVAATASLQGAVFQLVNAFRVRGHVFAHLDPLGTAPDAKPELELSKFGLSTRDLDTVFPTAGIAGMPERATLREIIAHMTETYVRSIGVEFTQIEDPDERQWLQTRMESTGNRGLLDESEMLRVFAKLTDAEILEQFIHRNYVGAKRFSLEGGESLIAMLDLLIESAGAHSVEEIIIGMAHRGRLNVLVNILGKNVREIFAAFDDKQPERFIGGGDVKYHLGYSSDQKTASGNTVHLSLAFNPSHLEWVNPVVEGRVRAKQDRSQRSSEIMPLLIHGDAAFMGQGIVPETLNLAGLAGYTTGGTIHLVVNNQIGFTTNPHDSRSTRYSTDIARMMRVPVFHVNGEDPEAVVQVARLAFEWRQRFHHDVVIDMYSYRRYGHNEGDEPRYTQPRMYALIDGKASVRQVYEDRLIALGVLTKEQADAIGLERKTALDKALEEARQGDFNQPPNAMGGLWAPFFGGPEQGRPDVATAVPREELIELLKKLATVPEGFTPNPKALKLIEQRRDRAIAGQPMDWGTAEILALATLLWEGRRIRLTGQDVRRGTFSHRHAALFDMQTGAAYVALAALGRGTLAMYDSPLSEAGVLGFEYGYSLDCPDGLVIWEAQFGDFLNTAQVIVDQFISSAEDKWKRLSGLVMLLPHGYEGQGPEHSSARIERFLQLAAEDNMQICNPTTPAQFFHLLRRQVLRPWRKPLIVFTPKSLLRSPDATSSLDDLSNGTFQRVIADASTDPKKVKKILFCSGKIYYDLMHARAERKRDDVAIIRLEQYYPIHPALDEALAPYKAKTPLVWVQDEPLNMGAWYFLKARIGDFTARDLPLSVVARHESASPATGSAASHRLEQQMLIDEAFA